MPVGAGEAQLVERAYGSFVRSVGLPKEVDRDAITAGYANGVLGLHVPKPVEARPKKIVIGAAVEAIGATE